MNVLATRVECREAFVVSGDDQIAALEAEKQVNGHAIGSGAQQYTRLAPAERPVAKSFFGGESKTFSPPTKN